MAQHLENPTEMNPAVKADLCDLRTVVHGMLERFHSMHGSLRNSKDKMPLAADHLKDITNQTEVAVIRILETAEAIAEREAILIVKLTALVAQFDDSRDNRLKEEITSCLLLAEQTQEGTDTIIESLQFQDVTAQQMDQALEVFADIDARLETIFGRPADPEPPRAAADNRTVGHARTKPGQADVDALIRNFRDQV